jgi:multicomponent K+:H+ antiporter subunit F
MGPWTAAVLPWVIGALALALLCCAWRLLRGPDLCDRILALDTLYIDALALFVVLGIQQQSALAFEAALLIALLGFVGTVALARHAARVGVMQ